MKPKAILILTLCLGLVAAVCYAQRTETVHEFSPAVYAAINASGLNAAEAMQRTLPHLSDTARAELAAAVDIEFVSPEKARVTAVRVEAASKEAELRDAPIIKERAVVEAPIEREEPR